MTSKTKVLAPKEIWAVMTQQKKVMRIMKTERSAKVYATKRGLALVAKMISPTQAQFAQQKGGVWYGLTSHDGRPITQYGWVRISSKPFPVTIERGTKKINEHFGKQKI